MRTPCLESEINELTHTIADWLEKYVGEGMVDRNLLNQRLDEFFVSYYRLQIEED